ncbi:hypothetical protein JL720_298 [Aureococcus anophagefferens]|nr:hypothetical protein JL720_298 [Aureococcus anophagefferens]
MGNASSLSPERIALVQGALGYLAFGECVVALRIFPDGAFLAPAKPFWQWMVERLAAERCLRTVGPDRFELLGVNGWRGCFERLWQSRHGVVASPALDGGPRRLAHDALRRPRAAAGAAAAAADRPPPEVTVPLHQRVALLRRRGLSAADAKAKAVAMKKGGLRATICGHDDARVHALAPYVGAKTYDFDRVLGAAATQEDVWKLAFPVVHDALNGRDGCVFAYGQSGSGKTHTMFDAAGGHPGLVARALGELVSAAPRGWAVVATYVEVFGDDLTDLLSGARIRSERRAQTARLAGVAAVDAFLAEGAARKRAAATMLNLRSTRAHAVVSARLVRDDDAVVSTLVLVDLGGSERVERSKVNENLLAPGGVASNNVESRNTWKDYYAARGRLQETTRINLGLLALKRCVTALLEDGAARVPFMDSKLTQLLEKPLSSRSVCAVICVGREDAHAAESIESLNFGEGLRRLRGDGEARGGAGAAISAALRAIDARAAELQRLIAAKERWEWRDAERTDVVDEMDTGGAVLVDEAMEMGGTGAIEILADDGKSTKVAHAHTVRGQVIVGAEAENRELEALLDQRRALLGES